MGVEAILAEIRRVTGWAGAVATMLVDVDGRLVYEAIASSGAVDLPRILRIPVMSLDSDHEIGAVCVVDTIGPPMSDAVLAQVNVLAQAASVSVLRAAAAQAARRRADTVDRALMETLRAVRAAEDQVSNSMAVVLGWLRVMSQGGPTSDGPPGGVQIAIRRLEEVQAAIADLLRHTATSAIEEHARDVVSVTAAAREVGLESLAAASGDVHVLANRSHLVAFLASAGPLVAAAPVVTDEAWMVPFERADLVGTALLLSLRASGGTMVPTKDRHAAAWPLAPRQVTP